MSRGERGKGAEARSVLYDDDDDDDEEDEEEDEVDEDDDEEEGMAKDVVRAKAGKAFAASMGGRYGTGGGARGRGEMLSGCAVRAARMLDIF